MHDVLHFLGLCSDSYLHPNLITLITGFDSFYFMINYFKYYYFEK